MEEEVVFKLKRIADVWNDFILKYQFCQRQLKYTEEVKTNYLGDILGYFHDTVPIVFSISRPFHFTEQFAYNISFLQAIYIQQDFIEELLLLFRTKLTKGHLKKDDDYSLNRDIRNELVGHPFRKLDGEFISSTVFAYHPPPDTIQYLRYQRDQNFKMENIIVSIDDIRRRHFNFLQRYFAIIINRSNSILRLYRKEIKKLTEQLDTLDFQVKIKLVQLYFEGFFETDYVYDPASILKIYTIKDSHSRYQSTIDTFNAELSEYLLETLNRIDKLIKGSESIPTDHFELPILDIENFLFGQNDFPQHNTPEKVTYHYEIGKLYTKRNLDDYQFFSSCLIDKCPDNDLVKKELLHMVNHFNNDLEYFCALNLIRYTLMPKD